MSKEYGSASSLDPEADASGSPSDEYLLVWTTTPWTLISDLAAAAMFDRRRPLHKSDNPVNRNLRKRPVEGGGW